jgi:hypothetical protein
MIETKYHFILMHSYKIFLQGYISSLEIDIFDLKMMMKSGLELLF